MITTNKCERRLNRDCVTCTRCKLQWDYDEPNPPNCKTGKELFNYERERLRWLNKTKKL